VSWPIWSVESTPDRTLPVRSAMRCSPGFASGSVRSTWPRASSITVAAAILRRPTGGTSNSISFGLKPTARP